MPTSDLPFGLPPAAIAAIVGVFACFPSVSRVLVYGSRAKGTYRPGSDIDLTMLGESLTTEDLLRVEDALDDLLLPYKIDLSVHAQIESRDLLDHIARVGQTFYDAGRP